MKDTLTGNRVLLKIAGQVVGSGIQDIQVQDQFGLQDVDGIGNPETQEFVVGKISHTITLSQYRVSGKDLVRLGLIPNSDEWLTSGELEIEVIDKITGQTQELYVGCKCDSHSRTYAKHVICGESATFRARHKEAL